MTSILLRTAALLALTCVAACSRQEAPASKHFEKTQTGVIVRPTEGPARVVRLEVVSPKVIRVTAFPTDETELPQSLMAVKHADGSVPVEVIEADGAVTLETSEISAEVRLDSGLVAFKDKSGQGVLSESLGAGRTFTA